MMYASIDIGSNTVRLLVGKVADKKLTPVYYGHESTRLSRGLGKTGLLSDMSMRETLAALQKFRMKITELGVSRITVAGTEALRRAENAPGFLETVWLKTGFETRILSETEEASLSALGVTFSFPASPSTLVLDIGGGSTEMSLSREGKVIKWASVPNGVVSILEKQGLSDIPSADEINGISMLSDEVSTCLHDEFDEVLDNQAKFIATAGTPTTAAAIDLKLREYDHDLVHGHKMTMEALENMLSMLASLSLEARMKIDGLEPKRADLIIPGIILTIRIMKSFGFHEVTISDKGLLEGLLLKLAGVQY